MGVDIMAAGKNMFEKNDKKRLYWLMDQYVLKKISAPTFCNEYYYCYSLELDTDTLDSREKEAFYALTNVVDRFSEFEEDHKKLPGVYFTEDQLQKKVLETKKILESQWGVATGFPTKEKKNS